MCVLIWVKLQYRVPVWHKMYCIDPGKYNATIHNFLWSVTCILCNTYAAFVNRQCLCILPPGWQQQKAW